MKALLIDSKNGQVSEVELDDQKPHLEQFYELLECRLIDIAYRNIGGRFFDIIIDDEGLFADDPKVSALNSKREPVLVGNLLFCNHDGEGNETSLSEEDIAHLMDHVAVARQQMPDGSEGEPLVVMMDVEYE